MRWILLLTLLALTGCFAKSKVVDSKFRWNDLTLQEQAKFNKLVLEAINGNTVLIQSGAAIGSTDVPDNAAIATFNAKLEEQGKALQETAQAADKLEHRISQAVDNPTKTGINLDKLKNLETYKTVLGTAISALGTGGSLTLGGGVLGTVGGLVALFMNRRKKKKGEDGKQETAA